MAESVDLREAFDEVADALEMYFEGKYGPECGMSCGGFLRAYRNLLTEAEELPGQGLRRGELDDRAEKLLHQFLVHFLRRRGHQSGEAELETSPYPPPYDPGPST